MQIFLLVLLSLLAAESARSGEIDPADYGFAPDAPAATNAVALQKALDGGHRTVRVTRPGVYNLDRPVFLDDATHLSFGADVVLQKAARYSNVLVNRGAWLGTTNRDITVQGLHIRVNGNDLMPPLESKAAGLRGHFAFYHMQRLRVFDYRILDVMGGQYAFHIADFDDVILDGFDVRGNKDGIHVNAGKRFVIRNGITCTGDDGIALNANDWPSSHTQGIWTDPVGTKFLFAQSDGCRTSSIRNVTFRNITLQSGRGFGCFWDAGAWARSMHPEVPVTDMPVTQISVDGLVSTGGRVFYGNCACDLMLRGIRHSGREPLVSLGGYGERTLRNRNLLSGSMFGPNGAKLSFAEAKTHARVLVEGCLSDGPIQVVTDRGANAEVLGQAKQN